MPLSKLPTSSGQRGWEIAFDKNSSYFNYSSDGIDFNPLVFSWTPSVNNWYHTAFVRNGKNLYFFVNGINTGSTADLTGVTINNGTASLEMGRRSSSYYGYINAYLDEIRISKDIARWTTNFSPPSGPYGSTGGIYFKDNTGTVFTLAGSTAVTTGQWGQAGNDIYFGGGKVAVGTSAVFGSRFSVIGSADNNFIITAGTSPAYSLAVSTTGDVSLGTGASTVTVAGALKFGDGTVLRSTAAISANLAGVAADTTTLAAAVAADTSTLHLGLFELGTPGDIMPGYPPFHVDSFFELDTDNTSIMPRP